MKPSQLNSVPKQVQDGLTEVLNSTTKYRGRSVRLLSLDGGGVRGVITTLMVKKVLEQAGVQAYEVFDMAIGTSIGGLEALAYFVEKDQKPLFNSSQIYDLIRENSVKVFQNSYLNDLETLDGIWSAKYKVDGLESVIKTFVDDTMTMENSLSKPVVLTALEIMGGSKGVKQEKSTFEFALETLRTSQPTFFAPKGIFKSLAETEKVLPKMNLFQMARGTTAAPTYFPAEIVNHHAFIDGGLVSNNPAGEGYLLAQQLFKQREIKVYSFGTGLTPSFDQGLDQAGAWGYASRILELMFSAMEGRAKQVLDPSIYYRMQVQGLDPARAKLDQASEISYLVDETEKYLEENEAYIEQVASTLTLRDSVDDHVQPVEIY